MSYLMTIDDMDTFIGLIEKRPSLYMKNLKEYTDTNVRKKLWEEVCTEIVPNWAELSAESRIKYGQEVQKKWLNLRSCFSRELRAQKNVKTGQSASKRRRYIYFEKLLFLLPTMEQRSAENNVDSQSVALEEFENQDSDSQESDVSPKPSTSQYRTSVTKRKEKRSVNFEEALLNILQKEAKIQILDIFRQIKQNGVTNQFIPNYNHLPHNLLHQQNIPTPVFTPLHHTSPSYTVNTPRIVIHQNVQDNASSSPFEHKHSAGRPSSVTSDNTEQPYFINFPDKSPKTETPSP
ncbi:uncharacterized protein LOC143144889 isoform X2 [Ptiloglossa arizonensis]|uniref:uncharacterized protein LOC143144889 isoform X2 n=1 Tax=Ptiloglossa arizonensis TaxID=3350558 RepID=UPI003F9EFD0B